MTSNQTRFLITILLVLARINAGSCTFLKCYVCAAPYKNGAEGCELGGEESMKVCNTETQLCGAHHYWPSRDEINQGIKDIMLRGCFEPDYCNYQMNKSMETYVHGLGQCFTCDSDLCNSSSRVFVSYSFIFVALITIKHYFM